MVSRLSDIELCRQAWEALTNRLGPVDAMRFLSISRGQTRDYQAWRDEHFRNKDLNELLDEVESAERMNGEGTN